MARKAYSNLLIDMRNLAGFKKSLSRYQRTYDYYTDRRDFFKNLEKTIKRKYTRKMLSELREAPAPRSYPDDYPIKFKSGKQRKHVMRLLRGKPYNRRNVLSKNWKVRVFARKDMLRIRVINDTPYRKYVVGYYGMGKSRRSIKRYTKPIQPYYTVTGWTPAYEIIQKYMNDAQEFAKEQASEWLEKGLTTG